jgi:hypothetical protein
MKYIKKYYPVIIIIFLLSIAVSCNKDAPVVNPGDYTQGGGGITPGYFYPFVSAVYPDDGATLIPVDSEYLMVFNIPVDADDFDTASGINVTSGTYGLLNAGTDYTITPGSGASTTARITFTLNTSRGEPNPLRQNDTISITVGSGIHSLITGMTDQPINLSASVGINASSPWTFTTGTDPDIIDPSITGGSQSPTGASESLTTTVVRITFNDTDIDVSSINYNTFYFEDSSFNRIASTYSYNSGTRTATLTPITYLQPGITYHAWVTTGIKDLSGRPLSGSFDWTFTTTSTPVDGVPGNPSITDGPNVFDVALTSAYVNWTTNEATDYTINYGRGNNLPLNISGAGDFSSFHSRSIPGLTAGQRYWLNIAYQDPANNPAVPATSTTVQFNTLTPHTGVVIDNSANNQHTVKTLSTTNGVFALWTSYSGTYNHLYGQLFNNSLTKQWNGGSPNPIFTEGQNFTHMSTADDGVGGVIVLASRAASGVYAKRITSGGAFVNWGATADQATDSGLAIDAAGSNGSAVPVYAGLVNSVANGQIDRTSLLLNNPFYEDADLGGGTTVFDNLAAGDRIYNITDQTGTTVDISSQTPDFEYIIGQGSLILAVGESYIIGDGVTNTTTATVTDHNMNVTDRNNGLTNIYTQHGFVRPAWLSLTGGDIVRIGTNYARITAINQISTSTIDNGTESADKTNHLIDGGKTWSPTIAVGDLSENTAGPTYSVITGVTDTDLALSADIFPNGNEAYALHDTIDSGTADSYGLNQLNDSTATWNTVGPTQVFVGDIVIRTNATYNSVQAFAYVTAVSSDTSLTLDNEIFPVGNENYVIYSQGILDSGTANSNRSSHIIDGTATWTTAPIVQVGDLVRNTTDNTYATVIAVTATDLALSANIFPDANSDGYEIYHEFCITHTGASSIQSFYEIQIDHNIGQADGNSLSFYNYKAAVGTQSPDTPPANPLYDDDGVNLTTLGVTALNINQYAAFNYSTGNRTTINIGTYAIHQFAMDLSANIFPTDNDEYRIFRYNTNLTNLSYSNIIDSGIADSDTLSHLTDGGHFGSVSAGDIAYNVSTQQYALVTNAVAGNLTLSWDAFPNGNEPYLIFNCRGVFYIWQEAGPIVRGKVLSIAGGGAPAELRAEFTIANGSNPRAIPDGLGNVLVVYEDTSNQIQARRINIAGTTAWTTEIDTNGSVETILDVQSDNSNGVVILYKYNNDLHAQRITNAGGRSWAAAGGRTFDNDGATTVTSQEFMVYNSNNVYIAANVNNEIWAASNLWAPVSITNLPLSIQRNPKLFLDGADLLIVWDDRRFERYVGYGVFGIKVAAATGIKNLAWYANASGGNDTDGVAIILSNYQEAYPNVHLAPYNSGNEVMLIWEDFDSNESDLLYIDPNAIGPPYFPAGIDLPY